jgi:hypothetical protein
VAAIFLTTALYSISFPPAVLALSVKTFIYLQVREVIPAAVAQSWIAIAGLTAGAVVSVTTTLVTGHSVVKSSCFTEKV